MIPVSINVSCILHDFFVQFISCAPVLVMLCFHVKMYTHIICVHVHVCMYNICVVSSGFWIYIVEVQLTVQTLQFEAVYFT